MTSLIDADGIIYVIGWNFREHMDNPGAIIEAEVATDNYIKTILTITQADDYIGSFSSNKCFRNEIYKVASYKGTRPEKPDWVKYWQPIIKKRLVEKWNFYQPLEQYIGGPYRGWKTGMEADDVIAAMANIIGVGNCIICSPDKDMRQIPGLHYDYKREGAMPEWVLPIDAQRNFVTQMLCGDTTDAILGVPGLGPVKVKKLLEDCNDPVEWSTQVMQQYCKYYGAYYGPIIYRETLLTVQLLSHTHPLWNDYAAILQEVFEKYKTSWIPQSNTVSPFDGEQQDYPGVGGTPFTLIFGEQ